MQTTRRRFRWVFLFLHLFVLHVAFGISEAFAADVTVSTETPIKFQYQRPTNWTDGLRVAGSTVSSTQSPKDKPFANCSIQIQELRGVSVTQEQINENLRDLPSRQELTQELATTWKNVVVESVGLNTISGYLGHRTVFTHGSGSNWAKMISTTIAISPNIIFSVGCGAAGDTMASAKDGYDYWYLDFNMFSSNVRIIP